MHLHKLALMLLDSDCNICYNVHESAFKDCESSLAGDWYKVPKERFTEPLLLDYILTYQDKLLKPNSLLHLKSLNNTIYLKYSVYAKSTN